MKKLSEIFFEEYCSNNPKELLEVGKLSMKAVHDAISLGLDDAETAIAIYARVFSAILDEIKEKKQTESNFTVKIAGRLELGYDSNNDDFNEANAFTVIMNHIESKNQDENINDDSQIDTITLCTQWNALNVRDNIEFINKCAIRGKKYLSEFINIKTESHEYIIPIFSIIHSQLVNYVRLKRVELDVPSYFINVAGLFDIGSEVDSEMEEHIVFIPEPSMKLDTKSDIIVNKE